MKIRTKLSLFTVTVVLVTTMAVAVWSYRQQKSLIEHNIAQIRARQSSGFASLCRQALTVDNELFMVNYVKLLQESPGIVYAYFVNGDGKIVVHSDSRFFYKDLSEWHKPSDVLEIATSVSLGQDVAGRAVIGFSEAYEKNLLQEVLGRTLKQIATTAAAIAGLVALAAILFAYALTKPLKVLAKGSEEIAKGNFKAEVQVRSSDEVAELAERFNSMARSLAALDELKDEFISSVSHDLRNPLSAIHMYANYMLNADEEKDKILPRHKSFLLTMMSSAKKLNLFVNNILDAAKIKAGRMEYFPKPVSLEPIAQDLYNLLGILAKQRGIVLVSEIPVGLPPILGDPERLEHVLANLLSNALKFTPEGGRVTIGARPIGERVEIYVIDTGKGIPQEDLAQLFQRFKQVLVAEQREQKIKGTGLGLYIVKKTVEDMGGSIRVESSLGRGTRFVLSMPKAPAEVSCEVVTPHPVYSGAVQAGPAHNVLVVDDDYAFAQFATMVLKSAGYRAIFVLNAEKALALIPSEKPDLILLDIDMPQMSGFEMIRKLQADPATAKIPVILCSMTKNPRELSEVRSFGVIDFLEKPLNEDKLKSRVGKALAQGRLV